MGFDADASVTAFANAYALSNAPDACPRITTSGTTTTVEGGCYRDNDKLVGSLVIDNFPSTRLYDPTRATHVTATSYGVELVTSLDGTYDEDPTRKTRDIALTTTHDIAELHLECDAPPDRPARMCTAAPGSSYHSRQIAAAVEGTWSNQRPFTGTITLRAADAITFNLSGTVDDCIPYEVSDGPAGCVLDYR